MTERIDLLAIVGGAQFTPSNRQIRARNEFYSVVPPELPPDVTAASCVAMGAPQALIKWWTTPGFADWWTSPNWEREESQRLLFQAMQRVSLILRDAEDPDMALKAAREAREIYTRLNTEKQQKFADDAIGEMSKEQLQDYIRKNTQAIK
jgi:hypothetical protein